MPPSFVCNVTLCTKNGITCVVWYSMENTTTMSIYIHLPTYIRMKLVLPTIVIKETIKNQQICLIPPKSIHLFKPCRIFILGTPYTGGLFKVKLSLGKDFPQTPPKAFFFTKIFHPNVAANGEICVNTLKKDWKPDLGIKHILLVSVFLSVHAYCFFTCIFRLFKYSGRFNNHPSNTDQFISLRHFRSLIIFFP